MPPVIKNICLPLPHHLGTVNCYLMETGAGYILIDTGSSNRRANLEKELESSGCQPCNLKLIILTHGDFDHTCNAAYLWKKFAIKIAMHNDDSGMVERRDMFSNRKGGNFLIRTLASIVFRFGKSDRFKPDLSIDEGIDLSEYEFDARVLSIPGHSKDSIRNLTGDRYLFYGDLFDNTDKPALNSIMDDLTVTYASLEKLKILEINADHPEHGAPFPLELFVENHQ